MIKAWRWLTGAAMALVSTVVFAAGAAQAAPTYGGTVSFTGLCPYSYRDGARHEATYAGFAVKGTLTGYTPGATYSLWLQPDDLDDYVWEDNITADASGDLAVAEAMDSVYGGEGWGESAYLVVSATRGSSGETVGGDMYVPGQVATYNGSVQSNPACNSSTAPSGTTFGLPDYFGPSLQNGTYNFGLMAPSAYTCCGYGYKTVVGVKQGDLVLSHGPQIASPNATVVRFDVLWRVRKPGAYKLILQKDGNLVLYSKANKALWQTKTYGHPGDELVLQKDGNVVIYSAAPQHKALWQSHTYRR